jgi:hypothetical protein
MNGFVECLKKLPCLDEKYHQQVTFLGKWDEWMKKAGKYKYLYEMDTDIAYDWLRVWANANHPSFQNYIIDTSDNVHDGFNHVTEKIIEEVIMTTDPDIISISLVLDSKDEENSEGMCNIDHEATSPYTVHTAVLPKPSLINAKVNSAIMAMLDIVQPKMMMLMKMQPMSRFYLMKNMPETDQLFQCHMNQMSQLWKGLTTKHY